MITGSVPHSSFQFFMIVIVRLWLRSNGHKWTSDETDRSRKNESRTKRMRTHGFPTIAHTLVQRCNLIDFKMHKTICWIEWISFIPGILNVRGLYQNNVDK